MILEESQPSATVIEVGLGGTRPVPAIGRSAVLLELLGITTSAVLLPALAGTKFTVSVQVPLTAIDLPEQVSPVPVPFRKFVGAVPASVMVPIFNGAVPVFLTVIVRVGLSTPICVCEKASDDGVSWMPGTRAVPLSCWV